MGTHMGTTTRRRRTRPVQVYLTDDERTRLEQLARASDTRTLSAYIRYHCLYAEGLGAAEAGAALASANGHASTHAEPLTALEPAHAR